MVSSCYILERLETPRLEERTLIMTCIKNPDPHICFLWRIQYGMPSFARAIPEDGKLIIFARNVHLGKLPTAGDIPYNG